MTIMLKNGKKALLDDLKSNILSQGQIALSSTISANNISDYNNRMPTVVYNIHNSNDVKTIDLMKLLYEYNRRLSENLATAILTTLDKHLYTQEEMETDLGLNK